jgi:hypothetical protein
VEVASLTFSDSDFSFPFNYGFNPEILDIIPPSLPKISPSLFSKEGLKSWSETSPFEKGG